MSRPGLVLSLGFIALTTLSATGGYARSVGFLCLECGTYALTDVVLNLLLFAPFGYVLGRSGMRPLAVVGAGLLVSGLVELAQVFLPGRYATARDVLSNGLGAGLGGLVGLHLAAWTTRGARHATTRLWTAVGGAWLAIALTGLLIRFDPPEGLYYGQWMPVRGTIVEWRGRLDSAFVDTLAVANGVSSHSMPLRDALAERVHVRLVGAAGTPRRRTAGIFALMTGAREEALLVAARGHDLVIRVRRRAEAWRMYAPEWRFREALRPLAPGAPFVIEFEGTPQRACARVNGVRHCAGRQAVGSTWTFARSFDDAVPTVHRLLDAVTILLLAFPVGLLLRSVPRGPAIAAAGLLIGGLVLVGRLAGLAWPGALEWCALVLALAAGAIAHRRLHGRSISGPVPPRPPTRPIP